jgi:hypothetical protein
VFNEDKFIEGDKSYNIRVKSIFFIFFLFCFWKILAK